MQYGAFVLEEEEMERGERVVVTQVMAGIKRDIQLYQEASSQNRLIGRQNIRRNLKLGVWVPIIEANQCTQDPHKKGS